MFSHFISPRYRCFKLSLHLTFSEYIFFFESNNRSKHNFEILTLLASLRLMITACNFPLADFSSISLFSECLQEKCGFLTKWNCGFVITQLCGIMYYSQLVNRSYTKSYLEIENMLLNIKNKYPLYHNDMLDKKINFIGPDWKMFPQCFLNR